MNKRGLSNIIATVLIVLLALAAVAIVWTVISNMIGDTSSEITLTNLCVQSEAKPTSCVYKAKDHVTITMQQVRGDNVITLVGIAVLKDGNRLNGKVASPGKLQTNKTTITLADDGSQIPGTAKAAVIVQDEEGNTKTCDESPITIPCNEV